MRNYLFLLLYLPMPFAGLIAPWVGMILWGWLSLINPHRDLWGFASTLPYVQYVALPTLLGVILTRERENLRLTGMLFLFGGLLAVMIVSSLNSLAPAITWLKFNEFWKIILFAAVLQMLLVNKARFHALAWLVAGCLGVYGVKGGALFVITAGGHHLTGPPDTIIGDRNHLAVAMLMAIPLMNYLRIHSKQPWLRLGLMAAIAATFLAVIGTYSRGGFVGMLAMGLFLWLRSRQKLRNLMFLLPLAVSLVFVVPEEWVSRINTIETASEEDASFQNRVVAWQTYFSAAVDRPLYGAGLYALNYGSVFQTYKPFETAVAGTVEGGLAAHSIYFQVMGELGFLGFAFWGAIGALTWFNFGRVIRRTQGRQDLLWANDLARMSQVSLVAFFVAGGALSIAFYNQFFIAASLSTALLIYVTKRLTEPAAASRRRPPLASVRPAASPS